MKKHWCRTWQLVISQLETVVQTNYLQILAQNVATCGFLLRNSCVDIGAKCGILWFLIETLVQTLAQNAATCGFSLRNSGIGIGTKFGNLRFLAQKQRCRQTTCGHWYKMWQLLVACVQSCVWCTLLTGEVCSFSYLRFVQHDSNILLIFLCAVWTN